MSLRVCPEDYIRLLNAYEGGPIGSVEMFDLIKLVAFKYSNPNLMETRL